MQNFYCDLFFHKLRMCKDWCTEFSKSNFGVGVEEFLFKRIISFAKEHVEKKWRKKKYCQKRTHCKCFSRNRRSYFKLTFPLHGIWEPLKTSGFWYFGVVRNRTLAWNGLTVDEFSYLKWPKIYLNGKFKNEFIDIPPPLLPKLWTV